MKRMNKFMLGVVIVGVLGGLMGLNAYLTRTTTDTHDHDHGQHESVNPPTLNQPNTPAPPKIVKKIHIYLIDPRGGEPTLTKVGRGLTKAQLGDELLIAANMLCEGSRPEEALENPMPTKVKVLSVDLKDGLATVNFSAELERNFPGGSTWEALAVDAIVKTMTQFPGVNRVQILVDGKKVDSLGGHIDISEPIAKNDEF